MGGAPWAPARRDPEGPPMQDSHGTTIERSRILSMLVYTAHSCPGPARVFKLWLGVKRAASSSRGEEARGRGVGVRRR